MASRSSRECSRRRASISSPRPSTRSCMRLSDIASSRIALLGFGAEGRATLEALERAGKGGAVDALILADAPVEGLESLAGTDAVDRARGVDVLVKSPGVKPSHPALVAAREAGVAITTATNLALAELRAAGLPVLGVTGRKGKRTTTSLAHAALVNAGRERSEERRVGKECRSGGATYQ